MVLDLTTARLRVSNQAGAVEAGSRWESIRCNLRREWIAAVGWSQARGPLAAIAGFSGGLWLKSRGSVRRAVRAGNARDWASADCRSGRGQLGGGVMMAADKNKRDRHFSAESTRSAHLLATSAASWRAVGQGRRIWQIDPDVCDLRQLRVLRA